MTKYMKEHERYILKAIELTENLDDLFNYHTQQILWLQHERMIHLLVFLCTALLFMSAFLLMLITTTPLTIILATLLGLLTSCYLYHYFKLENTVQRWYQISNTINHQRTSIGTNLFF